MNVYDLARGLHILAVIAWMAGLLYLPRLFVYHTKSSVGSETDETFKVMERNLFKMIMNPAYIIAFLLGSYLIYLNHDRWNGYEFLLKPWMLVKLTGVIILSVFHHFLGRAMKTFAVGERRHTEKFWRIMNELPFVCAIAMVLAVTLEFGA